VAVRENFVTDRPYAAEAHGTGVAGVIAAAENNRLGIAGVAPDARLLALRACWDGGAQGTICDSLSLAKALHFAVDRDAQVINLSLAGPQDRLLGRLIDVAIADGATVVAAADPDLPKGGFPASHPGVMAVGAGGEGAALTAPGHDVPTTLPGGRWSLVNGSSYAAAHVSGLMALIRQREPRARGAAALVTSRTNGTIDACASILHGAACGEPAGRAADARR
jgi:subtilisin family serine protease